MSIMIVTKNPTVDNPQADPPQSYRSIAVTNVQPGQGDVVATLDIKIGGIFIRRVRVRRGRNDSTYINFPSFKNAYGRWVTFVEVTSPALATAVNQAVMMAVSEATR